MWSHVCLSFSLKRLIHAPIFIQGSTTPTHLDIMSAVWPVWFNYELIYIWPILLLIQTIKYPYKVNLFSFRQLSDGFRFNLVPIISVFLFSLVTSNKVTDLVIAFRSYDRLTWPSLFLSSSEIYIIWGNMHNRCSVCLSEAHQFCSKN